MAVKLNDSNDREWWQTFGGKDPWWKNAYEWLTTDLFNPGQKGVAGKWIERTADAATDPFYTRRNAQKKKSQRKSSSYNRGSGFPSASKALGRMSDGVQEVARRNMMKQRAQAERSADSQRRLMTDQGGGASRDFLSFLEQAKQYLGGPIMPDFSEARNAANERYRTNDAKLQAIYDQLKSSILADEGGIKQNYADAGKSYDETADTAKANIEDAYNSARDAQAAELSALGIEQAAVNNANKQGGGATTDQAEAITGIEQNRAANQDRNTAHSASAVNYNTSIGQAAGTEGADRRANLAADLSRYLGELSAQEQQARTQAEQQYQNSVMSLASALSGDYWNQQDRSSQGERAALEQAMRERQMELDYDLKNRELDAKNDTGTPYDFAGSLNTYYQQLKKQYGNKLSEEDIWKRALQLAQGTGKYYG